MLSYTFFNGNYYVSTARRSESDFRLRAYNNTTRYVIFRLNVMKIDFNDSPPPVERATSACLYLVNRFKARIKVWAFYIYLVRFRRRNGLRIQFAVHLFYPSIESVRLRRFLRFTIAKVKGHNLDRFNFDPVNRVRTMRISLSYRKTVLPVITGGNYATVRDYSVFARNIFYCHF